MAKFIYFDYNFKCMNTIEDKIKGCEKWKQAKENLKNFKETMGLVKQYPVKPMKRTPLSPPYEILKDLLPYLF